jgi:subtilisin family serine protease
VPLGQELAAIAHFRTYENVRTAVPNFYVTSGQGGVAITENSIANAIAQVRAPPQGQNCGRGVTVAVLDTGLDPALLPNYPRAGLAQFDLDKPQKPPKPHDPVGHGTVVAYIIHEIAPGANLLPIKVMEETGTVWSVVCGLFAAEAHARPDIYNLSLQVKCDVSRCPYCRRGPGILPAHLELLFSSFLPTGLSGRTAPLLVAAAGNNTKQLLVPANLPTVLAVGAYSVTIFNTPDYSTYDSVPAARFILAPGGQNERDQCFAVKEREPCTRLERFFYGTSFSAAYVSGIAACYLCAAREGLCAPGAPSPPLAQPSGKEFIMECLVKSAQRDFPQFRAVKHGLGIARYDEDVARQVMSQWRAGSNDEGRRSFIGGNEQELRPAVLSRAYEIYEEEGRPEGHALHHWQRAKVELGLAEGGEL